MGSVALRAAGKEFACLRFHASAKDELIFAAAAILTGFAVQISANGSDFPKLFVHRCFLREVMPIGRAVEGDIGLRENL